MLSNHLTFNESGCYIFLKIACLGPCEQELFPAIRSLSERLLKSKLPYYQSVAGKGFYRLGEFQTWYDALPEDSPLRKNQKPFLLAIVAFQNDPSSKNRQTLEKLVTDRESNLSVQIENSNPLQFWQNFVGECAWLAEAKAVFRIGANAQERICHFSRRLRRRSAGDGRIQIAGGGTTAGANQFEGR